MCLAGLVAAFLAVRAERRSLEDIARPLTAVAGPAHAGTRTSGATEATGATGATGTAGATGVTGG